jgi:RNA polymerase sigma-70 factor (ECF subfamily)
MGVLLIQSSVFVNNVRLPLAECWRRCAVDPGNADAWEEMLRFHQSLIVGIVYRVARRWGPPRKDDVEDAVQEVCMKLSQHAWTQKMPDAENQAIESYLKALAANAASDYFRARNAQRRDAGRTASLNDSGIQQNLKDRFGAKEMDQRVLVGEIERMFEGLPRDLTVFRLYYVQSLTAKEIAAIPEVRLTEKGVESLIRRMKEAVRKQLDGSGEGIPVPGAS